MNEPALGIISDEGIEGSGSSPNPPAPALAARADGNNFEKTLKLISDIKIPANSNDSQRQNNRAKNNGTYGKKINRGKRSRIGHTEHYNIPALNCLFFLFPQGKKSRISFVVPLKQTEADSMTTNKG